MNFYLELAIKLVVIFAIVPTTALVIGYAELKLSSHMQSRIGPYYAGVRWGWAQLLADGFKFLQKEDIIPDNADRPVFALAPVMVMISTVAVFMIIPFGPSGYAIGRDVDMGIFYAMAISSVGTLGALMAGWSSGNKYSLIGGLRAGGQLIAYELPLVLGVVGVIIQAGTLSMQGIVEAQIAQGWPFAFTQFVGLFLFLIAALAEMNRTPFDMPIAESELVTGYLTEYSGFRFLLFFLAEYANIFAYSAIAATLFLGGWGFWGISTAWAGPFILLAKTFALAFVVIWFRWTFPRFREDQLQSLAWRWLVPIALANIAVTAILKVVI
ncbi:MAG: NADH-quinone oxidoreductase subunit NuoH [Acidimicrobiia bacterium]